MPINKLISTVKQNNEVITIVVAHATHISLFQAAKKAMENQIASFIFVGPLDEMKVLKENINFGEYDKALLTFVDAQNEKASALESVRLVKEGQGDVLMKGMLPTSILLKAVLNQEVGLRTGEVLSHLAAFAFPNKEKLLFLTDAAMNIAPNLKEKMEIVQNAVDAVRKINQNIPKVAALAAVETVNPAMQATLDAASLTQMNRRGQIKNCHVDGPLALDNAVSIEAANQKNIHSEVAGNADILFVPTIEAGNVLYKSLTYFGHAVVGGMIVGAKAPIILTSRADSVDSKLFSMAMAVTVSSSY